MQLIWSSILVFIATNIDDIFILLLFFSNPRYKTREIIAGQLLGIVTLIAISILGALAGLVIPPSYLGILGIFPIYLGLKALLRLYKGEAGDASLNHHTSKASKYQFLFVASITIANGGDNVGIYVPLFVGLTMIHLLVIVLVFLSMTLLWCFLANYLTAHPKLASPIKKVSIWLTPFLLIALGIFIIYKSQLIQSLINS